jgi:hypothetical protein
MLDPLPARDVDPEEQITRFLTQAKWFNPRTRHVTPQAFKPRIPKPPSTTFRTSVYRTQGCTGDLIWSIGDEYVTANRTDGQRVLARTDIRAKAVVHEGLLVEPVPIPHPRHADIVNWPDAPEQRLEKMNALALQAGEPILTPSSPVGP